VSALASPDRQVLTAASEEEVRQALSSVLKSRHFVHAPKKQKFLRLICDFYLDGRAHELNEYLIGREVFDRNEDYNPAADPIVRVGAHDIRKKLELYYQQEGANDEIRLDIPIGSYEPTFIHVHKRSEGEVSGQTAQTESRIRNVATLAERKPTPDIADVSSPEKIISSLKRRLRTLYATLALLLVAAGVLTVLKYWPDQESKERMAANDRSSLFPVWEPFLNSDTSTLLVLSSPPVYRLMNAGDSDVAMKNSVELPHEKSKILASVLSENFVFRNSLPNPRLVLSIDTYTGLGEAFGAQRVTDLLRTAGKSVIIKRSRTVSAEDLRGNHVVLLGSVWSNEWSGKLTKNEHFYVTGQATIENHHPRSGESREYRTKFEESTGKVIEDYALITIKPNISSPNVVMTLAGLRSAGTEAAADYVTNKNLLDSLNQRLRELGGKNGPPRHYQALLKVGVENGIPTTISLVAVHELTNSEK
jgi:hypothetical protein